eukprot:TRINITY_DN5159_c0_g1_i2.p4 TRINITY_DN5159_c0_g1~~TRINITY_DN5159_c0_g1_i2.p4  ORF type:complete len:167 (+),score=57.54 TRINITY_DN5159_c0_g1_i2:786-1286(+)
MVQARGVTARGVTARRLAEVTPRDVRGHVAAWQEEAEPPQEEAEPPRKKPRRGCRGKGTQEAKQARDKARRQRKAEEHRAARDDDERRLDAAADEAAARRGIDEGHLPWSGVTAATSNAHALAHRKGPWLSAAAVLVVAAVAAHAATAAKTAAAAAKTAAEVIDLT